MGIRVGPLATAIAALAVSACVDDPPAPITCPPTAEQQILECGFVDAAAIDFKCGVFPAKTCAVREGCRTSTTSGCRGANIECPTTDTPCFPTGDCPNAVRQEVAQAIRPGAVPTCATLNVFPEPDPPVWCSCGCRECAAVCDGKGPALYGRDRGIPGEPPVAMFQTDVFDLLPEQGFFGLYMSVRGRIDATIAVRTFAPNLNARFYEIDEQFDEFTEVVFFAEPGGVYTWARADNIPEVQFLIDQFGPDLVRPSLIEIIPGEEETIAELDCMIPFWAQR